MTMMVVMLVGRVGLSTADDGTEYPGAGCGVHERFYC